MKKIIILLAAAMLLFAFASCGTSNTPAETTAAEGTAELTEPAAPTELVFIEDGKTGFTVIRSETAQGYYLDTAAVLNKKLKSRFSPDFKITDDWLNPREPIPENVPELLLFETKREESKQAIADLDVEGYMIRVTDCKIVIVGTSPAACNEALYCFFDRLIPEYTKDGRTAFPIGLEIKEEFKASDFDIGQALREGKELCADFEVIFNYRGKDGFSTAQGAATDGKYAYVVMKKKEDNVETDRVVKIDMETMQVVLESQEMPLDHANDMTYDPIKKRLVVVNMLNNLISIIDPETLELVEQKTPAYGTWGVGYIDGAEQYAFLAYGSPSGLVITDSDFAPIRSSKLADTTGYIGQGMDADAKYAYVPLSPDSGARDNIIQIFDIKTGEYLGKVSVKTSMESESMFHIGDDHYLHFNSQGSKIATLEFYIRFE
ncbi:MAG: hypothetical protein IJY97_09195 [Clostridia bacterium]|nr:hypothetical protein [Clostridia bacterium]